MKRLVPTRPDRARKYKNHTAALSGDDLQKHVEVTCPLLYLLMTFGDGRDAGYGKLARVLLHDVEFDVLPGRHAF